MAGRAAGGRGWRTALVLLVALALLGAFVALVALPELAAYHERALAPGIGLRPASLFAFGLTVTLFVLLALVAGDGLVGEFEVMIGAFFGFFGVLTLLIAWAF